MALGDLPPRPTVTPLPPVIQPCPTSCCCVVSVAIGNIKLFHDDGPDRSANGHQFDFTIQMSFCAGSTSSSDCTLEWWEKTDRPCYHVDGNDYPATTFTDMYRLAPWGKTFNPWRDRKVPGPGGGPLTVVITDVPSLGNKPSLTLWRALEFKLTVKSGSGCTCGYPSATVTARQVLHIDGGKLVDRDCSFDVGLITWHDR